MYIGLIPKQSKNSSCNREIIVLKDNEATTEISGFIGLNRRTNLLHITL